MDLFLQSDGFAVSIRRFSRLSLSVLEGAVNYQEFRSSGNGLENTKPHPCPSPVMGDSLYTSV
jgi:hypothetical protein